MTRCLFALVIGINLQAAPPGSIGVSPLDDLLSRTGKQVEQFWDKLAGVHCIETVEQTKLGENGKPMVRRQAAFDYLVLMQLNGDELNMDESRVGRSKPPKQGERAMLTTSGFSTLVLVFHPHFKDSFQFTLAAEEDGTSRRVHFMQLRGKPSPAVLQLRTREYPIEWEGDAWVDERTGVISRIQAGLREPLTDVGLRKLSAMVTYAPVTLKDVPDPAWLPLEARIEAQTEHQHWVNDHMFSAYKQFGVTVEETQDSEKVAQKSAKR